MHIVIVRAGGIGGCFGARLAAAGGRAPFVARGRRGEALRRRQPLRSPPGRLRRPAAAACRFIVAARQPSAAGAPGAIA